VAQQVGAQARVEVAATAAQPAAVAQPVAARARVEEAVTVARPAAQPVGAQARVGVAAAAAQPAAAALAESVALAVLPVALERVVSPAVAAWALVVSLEVEAVAEESVAPVAQLEGVQQEDLADRAATQELRWQPLPTPSVRRRGLAAPRTASRLRLTTASPTSHRGLPPSRSWDP